MGVGEGLWGAQAVVVVVVFGDGVGVGVGVVEVGTGAWIVALEDGVGAPEAVGLPAVGGGEGAAGVSLGDEAFGCVEIEGGAGAGTGLGAVVLVDGLFDAATEGVVGVGGDDIAGVVVGVAGVTGFDQAFGGDWLAK